MGVSAVGKAAGQLVAHHAGPVMANMGPRMMPSMAHAPAVMPPQHQAPPGFQSVSFMHNGLHTTVHSNAPVMIKSCPDGSLMIGLPGNPQGQRSGFPSMQGAHHSPHADPPMDHYDQHASQPVRGGGSGGGILSQISGKLAQFGIPSTPQGMLAALRGAFGKGPGVGFQPAIMAAPPKDAPALGFTAAPHAPSAEELAALKDSMSHVAPGGGHQRMDVSGAVQKEMERLFPKDGPSQVSMKPLDGQSGPEILDRLQKQLLSGQGADTGRGHGTTQLGAPSGVIALPPPPPRATASTSSGGVPAAPSMPAALHQDPVASKQKPPVPPKPSFLTKASGQQAMTSNAQDPSGAHVVTGPTIDERVAAAKAKRAAEQPPASEGEHLDAIKQRGKEVSARWAAAVKKSSS